MKTSSSRWVASGSVRLTALLVFAIGVTNSCSWGGPPPDGANQQRIYNTLEVGFQQSWRIDTLITAARYPNLWGSVNKLFDEFAGIDFTTDQAYYIPDPNSGNDVVPNDPTVWPAPAGYGVFYESYALAHRNANYAFGIYFIGHIDGNDTLNLCPSGGSQYWDGVSIITAGANNIWSNVKDRASYVAVRDGEAVVRFSVCSGARENFLIHAVSHELGHQRGGLTDNTSSTQTLYHAGRVGTNRVDVMVPWNPVPTGNPTSLEWTNYQIPMFDFVTPLACTHGANNCQSNLCYWRSITN